MSLRIPPIAVAAFLFFCGVMGTRPLVPLLALELGIGAGEIGVLVAVFAIIPLALASRAGAWMDHHGTGRALLASGLVGALGLALPAFLPGRAGLYVSQLICGSGFTIFVLAAQNQAGRLAKTIWERERSIAVFSMGVALGGLAGPLLGGLAAERLGYATAFLLLTGPTLAAVGFVLHFVAGDRETEAASGGRALTPPPSLRTPLRVLGYHPYLGRAVLISSLILMGKDIYIAYFPIYALEAGLGASLIGTIVALHNGGGVVMRFAMLPLVRHLGKNRVIVLSIAVAAACFAALPLVSAVWALALVSLIMGMGLGVGQPLSISRTINLSPADKVGEVLGFRLACNRFTQVVTPLAAGGLLAFSAVPGVFVAIAVMMGLGSTRLAIPEEAEGGGA